MREQGPGCTPRLDNGPYRGGVRDWACSSHVPHREQPEAVLTQVAAFLLPVRGRGGDRGKGMTLEPF
jgi:hypothetical protein